MFDFALQRELDSETGGLDIPAGAIQAIKDSVAHLRLSPFACRKAGHSPFLRELIISFGHTGYVALFEIVGSDQVIIGAVRHQREDDRY